MTIMALGEKSKGNKRFYDLELWSKVLYCEELTSLSVVCKNRQIRLVIDYKNGKFDQEMNRLVFVKQKPIIGSQKFIVFDSGNLAVQLAPYGENLDSLISILNTYKNDGIKLYTKEIQKISHIRFMNELNKLMTHQQITTYDEISEIHKEAFGEFEQKFTDEDIATIIDIQLNVKDYTGKSIVEGLNDTQNRRFTNKYAQVRETIEYKIAATFDLTQEGVIRIKCPNCGASSPPGSKSKEIICAYCGSTYIVPKKILDML